MVGGGGSVDEASNRLGLPLDLLGEAESFKYGDGIYPDNVQTVSVFSDMMTQWRMGTAGASGLDYGVLPIVMRIRGIGRDERQDVFDGLRVMERAALKAFRGNR